MKVAVVSAHYPPNFVSGGTLVPQRTSRALRSLDVDVHVLAGWLGDEHPPLDVWDEVDETGLPVRWIATTPWTGWSDRRNFDNPEVDRRVGSWLEQLDPDIVHCHSLQSLGAGALRVAQQMGISTVVTLHDFWWWCARQFLCTRDGRPCSPVVAAGACSCEVDRAWLDERGQFLAPVLAACDRVVAVSRVSARVAVANGVDPARLVVIENGIVHEAPVATDAPAHAAPMSAPRLGAGVRLAFAGGPNPMKGVQVLADAVRQLAATGPWTLAAYGCAEVAALFGSDAVSTPPPYRPEDVGSVLDRTDVLVLPSVMRESYSILAREALSRGVPVVTSDSLGPEEVVVDGRNGLVVPSADPAALAAALDRVIDDPALLERLTTGCAGLPLPTLDDQAAALLELYGEICTPPTPPAVSFRSGERRCIRRALFVVGIEAAPLRYRARLPAEGLELLGVHTDVCHYRDPAVAALGERADVIIVYRVPATVQVLAFISAARRRGTPVAFDVDDLIFDPELGAEIPALSLLPPDEADRWMEGVRRYRSTMEHCDAFIGSTEMLVAHAQSTVGLPAYRWDNGVGVLLAKLSDEALDRPRTPGPLRIGYLSGTNTHDHDWRYLEPSVARLLDEHPDLEVWLVGMVTPTARLDPYAGRVRRRGLLHWTELPAILRDLDVNLAPMEPGSRFNEAKSAIKWLEAALTATPTVASPTGPFAEVITPGVSGALAEDGTAWYRSLSSLLADPQARVAMGTAARREALLGWAPALQGRRYLDILESIAPRPRLAVPSEWVTAHDEPDQPTALERYGLPTDADADVALDIERQREVSEAPGSPEGIWRVRAIGMARTVRDGGPSAGARLLAGSARRRLGARR